MSGAGRGLEGGIWGVLRRLAFLSSYPDPSASSPPTPSLRPVNGAVREESIHCKSVAEIATLVQKLADQSGLEVIRIRKPFHTDSPSIQGQWHPFTNKPTTLGGLRPREVQDAAPAQVQVP